jgi:hypothetical protein
MRIPRKILYLVALGVGVAALVGGLTIFEGSDAISQEAGYQPVVKQKQQNETKQNLAPIVRQYNP